MVDAKRRSSTQQPREDAPQGNERRRFSRIVHDHKGTATVEWYDAPPGHERTVLEIEEEQALVRRLRAHHLTIKHEDTHDPYTRVPNVDQKSGAGRPKDLRKLSAWIKMMRQLEESKHRRDDDEE